MLGLCITVTGGRFQPTLCSSHGGGTRGFAHVAHHRRRLQQYHTVLSCGGDPVLQRGSAEPQLIYQWFSVAKSQPSSQRGQIQLCSLGNKLLWSSPLLPHLFLQRSLHSKYALIATIIIRAYCTVFIGITKQWEPNKHWYVFITDSRKSWGCDSGTGKISYPPKAFVQQRKNKEKWCCWFWWFWEAKIHPAHPRSKQLANSWQHRYQSTPTYLTV